jgi:lactate permease
VIPELVAAAPILVVLLLMVWRRWPASRAGLMGAATALAGAVGYFGLGRVVLPTIGPLSATAGVVTEALFISATILWIIVPALAIYHMQVRTGAMDTMRDALGRLSSDPRILALLVAWFFALFAEGAAGFGASVALAAPFLVGVGFRPLHAVTIALIGHAVGVSFGAVGTPIVPQVAATGLDAVAISGATAIYHALLGWVPLAVVVVMVTRTHSADVGSQRAWPWAVLAGGLFLLPYYLLARYVGPELPTLGGSVVGGVIFVAIFRWWRGPVTASGLGPTVRTGRRVLRPVSAPPIERTAGRDLVTLKARPRGGASSSMIRAGAPYVLLIALVLVTRLVPPVRDATLAIEWTWSLLGEFSGSIAPLHHPGTLLAAAFVGGALLQRASRIDVRRALATTMSQLGAVTVALVAMLSLARLMLHAGMTDVLAVAAASGAGGMWPVLAPLVGLLGTFVTGSATASNVLLTDLQVSTANALRLPVLPLLGAQGFGAAVGNIVCPHNIVAAAATVGATGQEGEILRRTLWVAIGYALLGGVLALFLVAR